MTLVNIAVGVLINWRVDSIVAAVLAIETIILRFRGRRGLAVVAQEGALLFALVVLWTIGTSLSVLSRAGALARARHIWQFERAVGLPSETAVQHPFLSHPLLVQLLNSYYGTVHFPVMFGLLIWLFAWHRKSYGRWRTALVGFTGISLLVQLVPVAPPRLLPGTGLVDTAMLYHQSAYGSVAGFKADALAAMPSVHVGWALLVAAAVISVARTGWRWLAAAYPCLTTLAVVVTANHFWLDGIVAAVVLAVVLAAQGAVRRVRGGWPAGAAGSPPASPEVRPADAVRPSVPGLPPPPVQPRRSD